MDGGLNSEQRSAVNTLSGPLLVLAGAGTGKTRVVTVRIAKLIQSGVEPDRILAVTFTNKAAAEMKERVGAQLGKRLETMPAVSTFHSHCVRVLRRHIRKLGYPDQFAIYDRGDQESLARGVLREIRISGAMLKPSDLLFHIGHWKTKCIRPHDAEAVAETDKEHLAAIAYRRYQEKLKALGAVDFDDLLLCTEQLFSESKEALRHESNRFDHLLIDEYQDTNGSQYRIVRALASGHRNLCVVGDDDQSIYGWRGAEVQHILRFSKDWPDAKVVRLEQNYRSTAEILEMSNRLIAFNKTRHPKVLKPSRTGGPKPRVEQFKNETDEAQGVVADIQRLLLNPDWEPRDFAILFRTNEQPRAFETELRKVKLPYVLIGGMSFFDRREVRDLLAYLKLLSAPDDEVAARRIINTPPRGIGNKTIEQLTAAAVQQGVSLWTVMHRSGPLQTLAPVARQVVVSFCELIEKFRSRIESGESLVDITRSLLATIRYEDELSRTCDDENEQQARWAAVEEVVNALGAYESKARNPNLRGFIDDVALGDSEFDSEKDKQLKKNAIALMTMHSAKGLEFPHIYVVGLEEGLLPHHRSVQADGDAIDEERRLCYVGVTRAEERLTLSMALTRMKWGRPRDTIPSRFLFELIGQAENPHARDAAVHRR
ncbi:MAG: AAA family ATPase [Planctomycetaceae bacterium]|jgi:DNA helicase-2/ATP-dependent DNA helicase PcrA|nr:AAA family ATPase [Planctomycetaceae bacterium]